MVYLEFIDWDRSMPVDIFRHLVNQEGWVGEAEDEKIINIGRHKGLAGHPAYLCGWRINALARMDEWEGYFKSPAGRVDYPELAALQGLDFVRCGLYDELISGRLEDDAMHFVEYFDAGAEVTDEAVREHFSQRADNYDVERLAFLLRRVGLLGPAQGDVAIWSLPDFASAEAIIRESRRAGPLRPHRVGLYKNVGHELM